MTKPERLVAETFNLYEAKTHLSDLVERAAAGEEIVIAKAGKPLARLVPLAGVERGRTPGGWEGLVWIADDFDAPLPAEELSEFNGGPAKPRGPAS
ncbi:MAG: type II toxin-antitoxin system Phd/YefM family antitoxin [Gemmatimonadales bacterium]